MVREKLVQSNKDENTNGEELSEVKKRHQKEEEKYQLYERIYVGQLSEEEESDTDTDKLIYIPISHEDTNINKL